MDLMPAVYSAIEAVNESKVGEVVIEHRIPADDGREEVLSVTVRRTVLQPFPIFGDPET